MIQLNFNNKETNEKTKPEIQLYLSFLYAF